MLYGIIILFALAAVLGVTILLKWLSKADAPKSVIYAHGAVAAIGLVLLAIYGLQNPANYPQFSLILFVVAALGGFYMFFNNLKTNAKPVGIGFVHALLAVGGFVMLLIFAFA